MCTAPRLVHRTGWIALRVTPGQRRRCFGLLRSAGDAWAWVLDLNRGLRESGQPQVANFSALCRLLTGTTFRELSRHCAEEVLKRYSISFFEAVKRTRAGVSARVPRRKRGLVAVRFRTGCFSVAGERVRLGVARGAPELWVRLARPCPYPVESIASVSLVFEAGRLFLDCTAALPVEINDLDPGIVAGVDPGIIHPFAVVSGADALLVSGRQIRAEERLHLEDVKARNRRAGRKAPSKGQKGSRRWRCHRARAAKAEARHKRRVAQAHHEAARAVVAWAVHPRVGTLVVGHPKGITRRDVGHRQNLRLRTWRRTHLTACLKDKAQLAGIQVILVDERGTSSTCPECHKAVPKPRGRCFNCPHCGFTGHRDLVGAANIAARAPGRAQGESGGITHATSCVTHRRAGAPPARRDRRRHRFDERRSCPAPGRPGRPGSRSSGRRPVAGSPAAGTPRVTTGDARRGSLEHPHHTRWTSEKVH